MSCLRIMNFLRNTFTLMNRIQCSLPFPSKIEDDFLGEVYFPFLQKYKDHIHDIYFTLPMAPFLEDSMGGGFEVKEEKALEKEIDILLELQEFFKIPISATFNNISIPPSTKNLDLFIKNFKQYYDKGIRNITLPFIHWMASGKIQKAFPDLYIKNTVLNRVSNGQEFWDSALYGFDYINVDRNLIRDGKSLRDIKDAQKRFNEKHGKYVPISILVNEGCRGWCPMMDEHYTLNQNRTEVGSYFADERLSDNSCPKWRKEDPAYYLRLAQFISHPSQFEFLEKR